MTTNATTIPPTGSDRTRLLNGEILLNTQPHTDWGAAVTATMFLPVSRESAWQQLTTYSRWVEFFPDVTRSEVISQTAERSWKRLYQAATKSFLMFSAQVEVYLSVLERHLGDRQHIQFRMERGNFHDFSADLELHDYRDGTLLTYSVKATPTIPVPSMVLQQAMRIDLPSNMQQMRRVLCA
ncbi:SRPBCC family protein [Leptolyngbya sp. AN02str]|uniref:SRPBCC family protein n=1 Tax=Leptolyngbya sp. AN02str TaxID=3423363 RepID=UPI003D31D9E2